MRQIRQTIEELEKRYSCAMARRWSAADWAVCAVKVKPLEN
jgi:hypothetical protein